MSLDTKYRPQSFDDVLGQESTVQILRQYVKTGAGFHQSYMFAGAWGSGKTTLARILARALLCSNPIEGNPCDNCDSCRSILETGASENFYEVDAATNSGKDSVKQIVEATQYSTFSGKRCIYLMDEAHQLTTSAVDTLLKSLEDCVPGSEDKMLICLFCTTEPEKMRTTILSRCAPAFIIRPVSPIQIAERLALICQKEGLEYEQDALVLIGELTECHIRDALKAIEGVSMLGPVNTQNVAKYLHLDYAESILDILSSIRDDLGQALRKTEGLLKSLSPITAYEKLADMAMLAYRASLDVVNVPGYLDSDRVKKIGTIIGDDLLTYADKFSSRPGRPTLSMLLCDIAYLHRGPVVSQLVNRPILETKRKVEDSHTVGKVDNKPQTIDGVYVDPRAIKSADAPISNLPVPVLSQDLKDLTPQEFFHLVKRRVGELKMGKENSIGQERRDLLGNPGADESG